MGFNNFNVFALLLCSCLFGIILGTFRSKAHLVTDREMALTTAVYVAAVAFFYFQHFNKNVLLNYLVHHKTDIENKQLDELQEAHRRRILSLKNQHNIEVHHLRGNLNTINANLECLNSELSWLSNMYQDQMRTAQEQEDRVTYLEGKLQESGQLTPTTRQPFSAPPFQIQFANPPRRSRFGFAVKSPTVGASSPLAQVLEAGESEDH